MQVVNKIFSPLPFIYGKFTMTDTQPTTTTSPNSNVKASIRTIPPERWLEIASTLLLTISAVAAAWSAYEAARWSGLQTIDYSQADAHRVQATRAATLAGQARITDIMNFNFWLDAAESKNTTLQQFYERRFRDEFLVAFNAWLKTDALNNPNAPPSPVRMAEYQLADQAQSDRLQQEAADLFEAGRAANELSEKYILNGVILAIALFFGGISERFKWIWTRAVIISIGFVFLAYCLYGLVSDPIR
jgi:hypothetical protein